MYRCIRIALLILALALPTGVSSQSGDATWLTSMDGLETGIGRSWMAPLIWIEETTYVEMNDEGTPISEISSRSEPSSTPIVTTEMQTQMLSALVYEYDSAENAATGIERFYEAQQDQISRDPRNPATREFTPELDAETAYGHEGISELEDIDGQVSENAVVYVLVQNDNLVYQVFGMFVPGNHVDLAVAVAGQMLAAERGDAEPIYSMNGDSTGGLWEKLNAIEIAMPEGSTIADLEVFPPADNAAMGDSVAVPTISLDNLASVPGLSGSWHITYAPSDTGVLVSTPNALPEGVFNIELWVMDFHDSTHATAAAFSLNTALTEPLGIVTTEGGGFSADGREGITMVNSGFVRDRAIPEGDAAVVVFVEGSTLYAARVYANGPAPTPLANDLIDFMITTDPESGSMWLLFPQSGDDLLHGLEPLIVRHEDPEIGPVSTPVG